jgi:hypothetical protein
MFKKGQWVCGLCDNKQETYKWTYPGKVLDVNTYYVIFEIQDSSGPYEAYRSHDSLRLATKRDFDRQILDVSKNIVSSEEIISSLEEAQKYVSN